MQGLRARVVTAMPGTIRASSFVRGAVAERLLHSPRKRASERTWGFESLPLRWWHLWPLGSSDLGGFFRTCRRRDPNPRNAAAPHSRCGLSCGGAMRRPRSRRRCAPGFESLPLRWWHLWPLGSSDLGGFFRTCRRRDPNPRNAAAPHSRCGLSGGGAMRRPRSRRRCAPPANRRLQSFGLRRRSSRLLAHATTELAVTAIRAARALVPTSRRS